jgi:hypothetical protein
MSEYPVLAAMQTKTTPHLTPAPGEGAPLRTRAFSWMTISWFGVPTVLPTIAVRSGRPLATWQDEGARALVARLHPTDIP